MGCLARCNNPLLLLEKLFWNPAELLVKPNEHAPGDNQQAAEDDKDNLESIYGPSTEVVTDNKLLDDNSDNNMPTQEVERKELSNKLPILKPAPTSAPSTQPSNFGRKAYTPNIPNPNRTSWKDVNTRLMKVTKVAQAMKNLETSYNTLDWTLIKGDKPGAEEEKTEEIAAAPFARSNGASALRLQGKSCLGSQSS